MTGHGTVFPEKTDDASSIPGLSNSTNSTAIIMANTVDMITPPAYYALQPSSTQKPTEPVSMLKRQNRIGSPQRSDSAKQAQEDTLHSSGSPSKKHKTDPDLLFMKSSNNSAVIMQRQERQKRMQQQQRQLQDRLQQQEQDQQQQQPQQQQDQQQPEQQQHKDPVFQHPNKPSNMNSHSLFNQQGQSLKLARQQQHQKLQCQQQPMSGSAKHRKHRQQPGSAHASHSQPVKSAARLQTQSAQPTSRLARMSSIRDWPDQDTLHPAPSLLKNASPAGYAQAVKTPKRDLGPALTSSSSQTQGPASSQPVVKMERAPMDFGKAASFAQPALSNIGLIRPLSNWDSLLASPEASENSIASNPSANQPAKALANLQAATLGDPRLVHQAAGRAEDSTAATADSSSSHWLKPKSASEEGAILCKKEELQRENKSLRGKLADALRNASALRQDNSRVSEEKESLLQRLQGLTNENGVLKDQATAAGKEAQQLAAESPHIKRKMTLPASGLESGYHKVQKMDRHNAVAASYPEETSSCPISYMSKLHQWLDTHSQWISLAPDQQNNTDISKAMASADKLSTVPPIQSGSEASTAAMSQLLQLMKDVHVSDEQLAEAERSLQTKNVEGLEFLSKAKEILRVYLELMKCELESFVHHKSEKVKSYQEAAKLFQELQAKRVASGHIAGIFETVMGISGDAL